MTPAPSSPARIPDLVRERAGELGLCAVGFCSAEPLENARIALGQWLDRGFQGGLGYLEKRPADRANPRALLPTARTVIAVALRLPDPPDESAPGDLRGKLARFARYPSYQRLLGRKLEAIADTLTRGSPVATRVSVDSAPLLERPLARRAGIGFVADSALIAVPGQGTHVVLGELLVDLELEVDAPDERRCRGCGACRKACPTGALLGPGLVEARRCVSYLTQRSGVVPRELRAGMGRWVFGCDLCQSVCPENCSEADPRPADGALADPGLVELAWAEGAAFRRLVGESRLGEASPRLLGRNAAIALGNSGDDRALRPLVQIVREHSSPSVRLHAAWALGNWPEARPVLEEVLADDPDPAVRDEAEARLGAS